MTQLALSGTPRDGDAESSCVSDSGWSQFPGCCHDSGQCGTNATAAIVSLTIREGAYFEASLPSLDMPSASVLHPELMPYGTRSMMAMIW